jgi:RNA polymerase sigma factor for flagellar operon FliA
MLSAYAAQMPRPNREELVRQGLPLVRRIAFRLARRLPPNVQVDDLIGAGCEGLVKAADAYDPSQYPRFEPYAEVRIRGAILDELRAADPMTRHGRRRLAEVTTVIRGLTDELGRPPEDLEVATRLGIDLEAYQKLAEDFSRAPALARLGEVEPDDVYAPGNDPFELVADHERQALLARAITTLTERTQTVLALYYQEQCTQSEIGQILGVTEARICQILGEATVRLRAALGIETDARAAKQRRGRSQ